MEIGIWGFFFFYRLYNLIKIDLEREEKFLSYRDQQDGIAACLDVRTNRNGNSRSQNKHR